MSVYDEKVSAVIYPLILVRYKVQHRDLDILMAKDNVCIIMYKWSHGFKNPLYGF